MRQMDLCSKLYNPSVAEDTEATEGTLALSCATCWHLPIYQSPSPTSFFSGFKLPSPSSSLASFQSRKPQSIA